MKTTQERQTFGRWRRLDKRGSAGAAPQRSNLLTLMMLAIAVYFVLPLFWLVVSSTKTVTQLFDSFGLWFAHGGFNFVSNLRLTFTYNDGVYVTWLANTAIYAIVSATGAALLATLGGYGFAKFEFPGKRLAFTVVLGSIMVPFTALAIPTYLLLSKIDLIDTRWAIIIPSILSPFGLYLMRVYSAGAVPDALIEAARIDGANEFRVFRSVAFRLVAPGFVTVLLLSLVATWNNYFLPLVMLNNPKLYPVTVGLADWNSQATTGAGSQALYNIVIMGSLVSIVPLVAAFLFLQRYWRGGLTLGGVSG